MWIELYLLSPVLICIFLIAGINAIDCTQPGNNIVNTLLKDDITGDDSSVSIRGGPYYTCQVQGTTMGTYQELSVIMEYTIVGTDRVGMFEMICQISPDGWSRRIESLSVLSQSPGVTYDGSIGLWTNCSSCINAAGNDNNCVGCHSSCTDGLMRCTGSTSDDCCVVFEDDGVCSSDTECDKHNYVANEHNNFTCGCNLTSCDPGYSVTTNSSGCYCVLSNICMTQPSPCNNNGSCTLNSPPDNFTCNCTGTGYTTDTCNVCPECPDGYTMFSSNCSCYQSHICLINNPCNNGGNCTIQDGDNDNYTCICTLEYEGRNCTECIILCDDGYVIDEDCYKCVLADICVADNPCNNNGVCILDTAPDQYTCNCTGTGYTGTNCTDHVSTLVMTTPTQMLMRSRYHISNTASSETVSSIHTLIVYSTSSFNNESLVLTIQQTSTVPINDSTPVERDDTFTKGITIGSLVCAIIISVGVILVAMVIFILMTYRHKKKWTIDNSPNDNEYSTLPMKDGPVPMLLSSDYDYCTTTNETLQESTDNEDRNGNLPSLYSVVEHTSPKDNTIVNEEPLLYSVVNKPLKRHVSLKDSPTVNDEPPLYSVVNKPLNEHKMPPKNSPLKPPRSTSMEPEHEPYDVLKRDTPYSIHTQQLQYSEDTGATYDMILQR